MTKEEIVSIYRKWFRDRFDREADSIPVNIEGEHLLHVIFDELADFCYTIYR